MIGYPPATYAAAAGVPSLARSTESTESPAASVPDVTRNSSPTNTNSSPYCFCWLRAVISSGALVIVNIPGTYVIVPYDPNPVPARLERTMPYVPTGAVAGLTTSPMAFVIVTSIPVTVSVPFVTSIERI